MTDEHDKNVDLDTYFKAGRQAAPQPSSDLLARIEADIDAVQAERRMESRPADPIKPTLFAKILDSIGGWPAISGIATAGVVGVVVGINPPEALTDFTSIFVNGTSDLYLVDPYDGFGFESFEG